jgi:hypothetical protein
MANTSIKELQSIIEKLQTERKAHLEAINEIDGAFSKMGVAVDASGARPAGGRGKAGRPRRTRRKFKVSGLESIHRFVKSAGAKGVSGAQIDAHWKKEGRAGSAYNMLGQLVRERRVKRHNLKGQRGSVYTAG